MENTLILLKNATLNKDYNYIKSILENFDSNRKGTLFEKYLCFLYNGNGYVAKHVGGKGDGGTDILLYHPSNLDIPMFIVQSKNHLRPLSFDDARLELIKFETESKDMYNCNNYILISINDFVSDCEKLKRTNMKFESWEYICDLINRFDDSNNQQSLRIDLFAHNANSYNELCDYLIDSNKAAVVQATGTGKSCVIKQMMLDYNNSDKIIVAPSTLILDRLHDSYVGRTDNALFLTYQKLCQMKTSDFADLDVKLVVFDELHRLGAPIWNKGYQMLEKLFPTAKLVGFSATPTRYLESRNMVEELFDGNCTDELSLTDAIVRNILPMPKYISSLYTLEEEINNRKDKINKSNLDENEKNKALTTLDGIALNWEKTNGVEGILKKHIPDTSDNLKFMVFCEDQNHLDSMEHVIFSWFKKAFKSKRVKLYTITSKTSNNKEEEELFVNNKSKNTIDILLSINMYNEGIHISGISGIVMLRNTNSPTIYYQQIGRAIDVNTSNPIIFDLVNNFNNFNSPNFVNSLTESYNKEKKYRGELNLPSPDESVFLQVNDYVSNSLSLFKDFDSLIRPVWEDKYNELVEYQKANGHCNIPQRECTLGKWIRNQREAYKKDTISTERIELLEKIGFIWDVKEAEWQEMYNELLEYVKINKHCNIPCSKGKLGRWAATQRTSYRKTSISSERIKLLEDIGFVWNIEEVRWQEMYNKLLEYKKSNNHCEFSIKEEKLDKWVSRQRESFNNNKLSAERIKLLEDIGFIWNPFESEWQEMYNELLEYKESNGHCDMPKREGKLGLWISTQRINYKNNILSTERIKLLEEIGFKWNIEEAKWQDMYSKLLEYKKTNGHCNVPLKTFKLGRWISTQRKKYKDNTLSDERIKLLEDAGFIWSVEESRWQEMYSELLEYKKSNNNCNVPQREGALGTWVSNQRKNYKTKKISSDKVELLNEIGFIWSLKTN